MRVVTFWPLDITAFQQVSNTVTRMIRILIQDSRMLAQALPQLVAPALMRAWLSTLNKMRYCNVAMCGISTPST